MTRSTYTPVLPFKGYLGQLPHLLTSEVGDPVPRGTWARRRLSKGAVVSLMRQSDGARVILFSRDTHPSDDTWEAEVQLFLQWFGARRWAPTEELPETAFQGIQARRWSAFVEPL